MEDKVIHEFRLIETDDGYRIEIRGDKDWIRRHGLIPCFPGQGRMKYHSGHRGHHHRHPRHGAGGWLGNPWFRDPVMKPRTRYRDQGWFTGEDSSAPESEDTSSREE